MKNIIFVIQLAVLMVIAFASLAVADSRDEMIAKYIKLSGVENALDSFPDQLEALSTQRLMTSKTPEADKKATELLKEAFDGRRAKEELLSFMSSKMDDALLQSLLRWYESPLAQKVVNEESNSSGADKQANLLRYLASLQDNPPTKERITLIQDVESSTQLSELTTNIAIELMKGMFKTIILSLPKEKQVDVVDIEKNISEVKPLLKEEFRKQMILSSYYTYRNLSDDELKEYIAFYKTKVGQKEIEITGSALSHVLNQWFAVAADKIIAYLSKETENRFAKADDCEKVMSDNCIIAETDGVRITVGDYLKEKSMLPDNLKELANTEDGKLQMLESLLLRELIVKEALKEKLNDGMVVKGEMDDLSKKVLVEAYLKKYINSSDKAAQEQQFIDIKSNFRSKHIFKISDKLNIVE